MRRQKQVLEKVAATFGAGPALLRQGLAECLAALLLVMFGCGAAAQALLSRGSHGSFLTVNLAFGLAASLGVMASAKVSGGHLNPAVTFALCLLGREPWRKFPFFFFFQTLGGFLGAALVFAVYHDALWDFGRGQLVVVGNDSTAGIFATYPAKHLSLMNGVSDQVIGTTALVACVLAVVDPRLRPLPRGLEPVAVGAAVTAVGMAMGYNSGYAVNPARDLGPRLFTASAGWGAGVFTANSYWFLVPLCAPFLGAAVGLLMYQLMVGCHLEGEAKETPKEEEEERRLRLSTIGEGA